MFATLAVAAFAQSIPNGDFEDGTIDGWSVVNGPQGAADVFPSSVELVWVMEVVRSNGRAVVCSSPFVVTRQTVVAQMFGLFSNDDAGWRLADPLSISIPLVEESESVNSSGGYSDHDLAATVACGLEVVVCVEPEKDASVYFDDFLLDGDACPAFVDGDQDGFCPTGQDVDADGDCTGDLEFDGPSDCDDGPYGFGVNPAILELCNGIDDNCDLQIDEGFDLDGDGWICDDCDDAASGVHPTAVEACNEDDDDCDGQVDEGFDLDGDSWVCDDCDDRVSSTHPDAVEQCNEIDDDCNGLVDDDVVITTWWPDGDGDLHGDPDGIPVDDCVAPEGYVDDATDCDDDDFDRHPGADDLPGDGVDSDCDGSDAEAATPESPDRGAQVEPPAQVPAGCGCAHGGVGGAWFGVWVLVVRRKAAVQRRSTQ